MSVLPLNVYFLGSGAIAVPVLAALRHAPEAIRLLGVGTQPDRPAGRKLNPVPTPIGLYAAQSELPTDKFTSVNEGRLAAKLTDTAADFLVVVSFGQLLKEPLLTLPRFGCVNVHASLLPAYRGASPIAAAITNGDAQTGVSFMAMAKGLDTGDVYHRCVCPLDGTERAPELERKLGELAGEQIVATLRGIADGTLKGQVQPELGVSIVKKLKKSDGAIPWRASAARCEAQVRACYDWPGAYFDLPLAGGVVRLGLRAARVVPDRSGTPGEILAADRHGWLIATGEGALEILEVTPPGRKPMAGVGFLNGCREMLTGKNLIVETMEKYGNQ